MAVRYIGRARLLVTFVDSGWKPGYEVHISAGRVHETVYVVAPLHRGYGVDHPLAYDQAAHAAASFAEKDTIKEALEDGGIGEAGWIVRRSQSARRNPATAQVVQARWKRPTRTTFGHYDLIVLVGSTTHRVTANHYGQITSAPPRSKADASAIAHAVSAWRPRGRP